MADGSQEPGPRPSSADVLTVAPAAIPAKEQEGWRQALINESVQIETAATVWSGAYRRRAGFFHSVGTYLALASALVATLAGGTGLALTGETGAILALVAAGLAAVSTTLGAGTRTGQEQDGAIANTNLADAARVFATAVAPYGSPDEVMRSFTGLTAQRDEVVRTAPIEAKRTLKEVEKELRRVEAESEQPPLSYKPSQPDVAGVGHGSPRSK